MSRIQFEIPNEIAAELARRADSRGVSTDRYVAELVRREIATETASGWPAGFFDRVVGRWQGELERPVDQSQEARDGL